jgi:hypothetical protein
MAKKEVKIYERVFEECVMDGHLVVPELEQRYVHGYSLNFKGKYGEEVHEVEYQIAKFNDCVDEVEGCESEWVGFKIGGAVSPVAIYKCKHGENSNGLVVSHKQYGKEEIS